MMNAPAGIALLSIEQVWIKRPAAPVRVRRWKQNFQAIGCGRRRSRCLRAPSACIGNFSPLPARAPRSRGSRPSTSSRPNARCLVLVALPGVDFDEVKASINQGELLISGSRTYPEEMQTAIIHRLELPQGRFERRVRLPAGRYSAIHRSASNGHLLITLAKIGGLQWLTPQRAPKRPLARRPSPPLPPDSLIIVPVRGLVSVSGNGVADHPRPAPFCAGGAESGEGAEAGRHCDAAQR